MASTRFQVLQAIATHLETTITPRPPLVRIGYINYQSVHAHPAMFVTVGPGSTVVRQQHAPTWQHNFMVRIAWLAKGSDAEPLEERGLQIHDQLITAFDADPTLGGLVTVIEMVGELGTDEGELALAGSPIGPFWQDFLVRYKQLGQSRIG